MTSSISPVGLHYTESFTSLYETSTPDLSALEPLAGTKTGKWIGIAPFRSCLNRLCFASVNRARSFRALSTTNTRLPFKRNSRGYEEALLDQWAFEYPRVKSVAGKYSLDQELASPRSDKSFPGAWRRGRYRSICPSSFPQGVPRRINQGSGLIKRGERFRIMKVRRYGTHPHNVRSPGEVV